MFAFHTIVDGDHAPHDHEFMEIVLITGGEGVHVCQAADEPLSAGDVIIMRPGAWHAYRNCRELAVYNCCLGLQILSRELAFASHYPLLNYLFWVGPLTTENRGVLRVHVDAQSAAECISRLDSLSECCADHTDPCATLESIGYLLLFLATIARNLKNPLSEGLEPYCAHAAVLECRRLLEETCDQEWTLMQLADRVHLAPAYLVRIFKQGTGLSPIAFLNRCRAERAAMLLLRTSKPITQIGDEVGWPDASYFARCFKKCFDMTATEYRSRFSHR